MNPNLKLTVISSLLFMSTIAFAQTTATTPVTSSVPATAIPVVIDNTNSEIKTVTTVKKKTPAKKLIKKPIKIIPKEINMVSENNIIEEVPLVKEYYDYKNLRIIPKITSTEDKKGLFSNKISPKLAFLAFDEQGNHYPIENFVYKNGSNLTVIKMNTDLSKANEIELSTDSNFDPLFEKGNCQAFFVKYQLKGNKDFRINNFFLNNEGEIETTLPPSCKVTTKNEKDSTDYSSKGYISDVSFTKPISLHTDKFDFILHLVKNGKDYFGQNIKGYVVNSNFDQIYLPVITPHRKGPYFGTTFVTSPPKPGLYNIVIPFNVDEGKQIVKVSRTVQ